MPGGLTKKTFPRRENNHINQFDHTIECQIQIKYFLTLTPPRGLEKKRTNKPNVETCTKIQPNHLKTLYQT